MTQVQSTERLTSLEFAQCVFALAEDTDECFAIDVSANPGDLALIVSEDRLHDEALTAAACGLLAPRSGQVRFAQHDWPSLPVDQANALRGHIGIVFGRDSWIPYQPLGVSVLMAQRHHTRRDDADLLDEAASWATHFGLPGLPHDLPHLVSEQDRQGANLVRAFLGDPALIIVEPGALPYTPERRNALLNAVRRARDRNAVVLWYTREEDMAANPPIAGTYTIRLGSNSAGEGSDVT